MHTSRSSYIVRDIGRLRWITLPFSLPVIGRGPLFMSPDCCVWWVPSIITWALLLGTHYTCGHMIRSDGIFAVPFLYFLVFVAGVSAAACGLSDPGFIPKPTLEAPDPYAVEGRKVGWRFCEWCRLYRPPRAAHCYLCGMCCLSHDHHCGVIGGCVGLRSLRWFTLFLVSTASACAFGEQWLVRSLYQGDPNAPTYAPTPVPAPQGRRRRYNNHSHDDSLFMVSHIVLMIFVGNVLLMVGSLAGYYVYLLLSDTTRREAQGKGGEIGHLFFEELYYHEDSAKSLRAHWAWKRLGALGRSLFPPPSLLDPDSNAYKYNQYDDTDDEHETDGLDKNQTAKQRRKSGPQTPDGLPKDSNLL